jgi:sec-independent protein translocase protein TatA
LLLFGGGGKIPKLMKDMGVGINAFKRGLKEEKGGAEAKDADAARLERGEAASTAERKETVKS